MENLYSESVLWYNNVYTRVYTKGVIMQPEHELSEPARRILEVIRAQQGAWVTRLQIAKALGRKRMIPQDAVILDLLVAKGLIV